MDSLFVCIYLFQDVVDVNNSKNDIDDQPQTTTTETLAEEDTRSEHVISQQSSLIKYLCQCLSVDASKLLTNEVTSHPEFMHLLSNISISVKNYNTEYLKWQQRAKFKKKGVQPVIHFDIGSEQSYTSP